jgi:regulator of protease activity HflC (stomatin/prohibitin superfamily)
MSGKFVSGLVGVVLGILLLFLCIYTVPAGSVGVVTRWGAVNRVVQPGMGVKIPIAEGVHRMSVRTQKDEVPAASVSSNLQTVTAVIAVNYHLDGQYAVDVYQNVGTAYQEIIIAPAIQNVFKGTTANYTAENLIKQRDVVRLAAEQSLQEQLEPYHIVVENFNIINFDFSPEYNAAIEKKQVAEQAVQTAQQELARANVEAQTRVVEAQAQADAQKALKDSGSLTPEYLQYLFLSKWNGILPEVVSGATAVFDVNNYLKDTTTE